MTCDLGVRGPTVSKLPTKRSPSMEFLFAALCRCPTVVVYNIFYAFNSKFQYFTKHLSSADTFKIGQIHDSPVTNDTKPSPLQFQAFAENYLSGKHYGKYKKNAGRQQSRFLLDSENSGF